ncbi:hypothetical protein [Amycolatopsis sp. CA-230715]|uniref:hypothetical protein n=1 Tax=Amycolatopsis sp. CA-230715 TaxID=2745196 RepID=UPI0020B425C8|nr:hypothetical protein [Amycolatopsis sp. CA-230715]
MHWNALGVAAFVGIAIVAVAWWLGPGLFGIANAEAGDVVEAKVTAPVECAGQGGHETVAFTLGGQPRTGTLDGCGHGKDERVSIRVGSDAGSGTVSVTAADTAEGARDLRRPVGLFLVALSCFAGATYAFIVRQNSR